MKTVKDEILDKIAQYGRVNKEHPKFLELSYAVAYELCALDATALGADFIEELILRGPDALSGEMLFGCEIKLIAEYTKKIIEPKGKKPVQSVPAKKRTTGHNRHNRPRRGSSADQSS